MTISCLQCHALNKADAQFCIRCGHILSNPTTTHTGDGATKPLLATTEPATASPTPVKTGTGAKTQRLSATTAQEEPLTEGELLDQKRYLVVAHLETTPTGNRYLVQDRIFRRCPQCSHEQPRGDDFCEACGAQLKGELFYLLIEAYEGAVLARAAAVAKRGFTHRHLVNLRGTFQDQAPGKDMRTYLLKDPVLVHAEQPSIRPARRLLDSPNITLPQTLDWLRLVAALLDDAAAQGVYFNAVDPIDLLLYDNMLVVDAAETAEALNIQRQPEIATHHQRHLLQLFRALTYEQTLPVAMTTALTELQSAPVGSAQALVERLQTALTNTQTTAHPLSLTVGYLSDLGLVREINEDSLTTLNLAQVYNSAPSSLHLCAVADGMGGHAAGEVASQMALKQLTQTLLTQTLAFTASTNLLTMLKQAGKEAARAVHAEAQRTRSDMGTTLVATLIDSTQRKLYAVNVGDSRLYKLDAATIRQITKDHSLVQRLIDNNQLTPEEARHHPNANLIYRTLGERANVEIDTFEESLAPGESLLLCSDGLSGLVDDDEMHRIIVTAPSPQAACTRLVDLAKAAGGHDNITVIIVTAQPDDALPKERPT